MNARAGQPLGWAVRTDDLAAVAGRLGLETLDRVAVHRDGGIARWQIAKLSARWPSLLLLLRRVGCRVGLGRIAVEHPAAATGIKRLIIAGEPKRLSSWLDGHRLPLTLADRGSGVIGVVPSTRSGEIVD